MNVDIIIGSLIPLAGTTLGALAVYFFKQSGGERIGVNLSLMAAGVMLAASVWGLIIPSIYLSSDMDIFSFIPAAAGIWLGTLFFIAIEKFIPEKGKIMPLAVVIHNVPEGMAVGVALASAIGNPSLLASAYALSIGIAVQNIPEGAIISLPMYGLNKNKHKSFACGFLSGVVEPIASAITLLLVRLVSFVMPYLMSFAAGCMIYVCVKELIPEIKKRNDFVPLLFFVFGFSVMLALDVALG